MKPSRPDSAKSTRTKITIDSDVSSRELNFSKFSQTYASGVNQQKKNDFHKYVSEKNRDQKFRKFVQSGLPEIPEKPQQPSKHASKPFQRKSSRIKQQKKVQETTNKQTNTNSTKKIIFNNGQSFVEKRKQKLNGLKINTSKPKQQKPKQQQTQKSQPKSGNKPRISFDSFIVKEPGKPGKKLKDIDEKISQKKEISEDNSRVMQLMELSRFIEQVEHRNIDVYPNQYEEFIRKNQNNTSIEKININDFIDEPNEKDYQHMMKKIRSNEKMLEQGGNMHDSYYSSKSSSINLDAVIDGSEGDSNNIELQQADDNQSVALSSMTASQVRQRNMFLTQILKRRITQQDIQQLKESDLTHMKLHKLESSVKKEEEFSDDQIEMTKINMSKKKTSKIMLKNKIEAGGDIYRQCDFLSPEEQQRIEQLIGDTDIESPFIPNQMEQLMEKRIDEGIHLYQDPQKPQQSQQTIIPQQILPKDPLLRKQAQLKILKQKINSVNSRLRNVDHVVINKNKIQNLIDKFKSSTNISRDGEVLMEQKKRELYEQENRLILASQLILKIEGEKQEINMVLDELNDEYVRASQEIETMKQMDTEQIRQLELTELARKKESADRIENQIKDFEQQIHSFEAIGQQLQYNLRQLDQIVRIELPELSCQNHKQDETLEDLDRIITLKWQRLQRLPQQIENSHQQ